MALFEKKEAGLRVSPDIAECDARLAMLLQREQETIYKLGLKFAENNKAADSEGSIYAAELEDLEAVRQEKKTVEVKKLALQGLRKCEKCGNVLVLDSAFCNKCGEKLEPLQTDHIASELHCPKCGKPVEADAAFCFACGHKL